MVAPLVNQVSFDDIEDQLSMISTDSPDVFHPAVSEFSQTKTANGGDSLDVDPSRDGVALYFWGNPGP